MEPLIHIHCILEHTIYNSSRKKNYLQCIECSENEYGNYYQKSIYLGWWRDSRRRFERRG